MASSPDARRRRVVCAGIAVIDNVYRIAEFPEPNTKTRASDFIQILGGCAANAAVAVRRLGGEAKLASPIGGPAGIDLTGDAILARLKAERIDASASVRVDGATSSLSSIFVDRNGERLIVSYRHPGLDAARPADPARIVAGADALLVDNRFPDFVLPIARAARAQNIPVVLDGDQPASLTDELIRVATHIVFSAGGLRATAQNDDLELALVALAARTDATVAVTDGANDMLWLEAGKLQRLQAFKVDVVDTLGAGDVFHGAFTLALADARGMRDAMRFAAATAALKCTRFGGGTSCPDRVEVERFLASRAQNFGFP